jgi:hypothetical protein
MFMRKLSIIYGMLLFGFILGIHEGRIALWKDNDPEPYKVFPYYASMLPRKDRNALKKGIYLENEDQLRQLVEEYLS